MIILVSSSPDSVLIIEKKKKKKKKKKKTAKKKYTYFEIQENSKYCNQHGESSCENYLPFWPNMHK